MTLLELWDETELPIEPARSTALESGRYGEVVGGRYELRLKLGLGDSSTVWHARDVAAGTDVAVKVLNPELARSPLGRARFAAEATFAAWVRSSRIVRGRDSDVSSARPWIAFELVRGATLAARIGQRGPLAPAEACALIGELAQGLARLRSFGVVHRDLSPDNVLLEARGRVVIADLGNAKLDGPAEDFDPERGLVTGVADFRAPEQELALETIDHRADVFALVRLSAYVLGGEAMALAYAPELRAYFERGLALDADRRFQTAEEAAFAFRVALRRALELRPLRAGTR